jgi:uncharacterized protein (DUF362 family)
MKVEGGNLPRNNIVIWDCSNNHLTSRGDYTIYAGSDPDTVRCFGTDQVGYDYAAQFQVQGKTITPSSILTTHCDYLINLGILKDHGMAGVTLGMKNHLGSITPPGNCHGIDPDIPELNRKLRDNFGAKEKLIIIDSLVGVGNGGPTGAPTFIYNGIVLSGDIVSADYQGRKILQENGWDGYPAATYIETADTSYGLGTADPAHMDVVKCDPIVPATREYVDRMVSFHRENLATELQVQWALNRYSRGL